MKKEYFSKYSLFYIYFLLFGLSIISILFAAVYALNLNILMGVSLIASAGAFFGYMQFKNNIDKKYKETLDKICYYPLVLLAISTLIFVFGLLFKNISSGFILIIIAAILITTFVLKNVPAFKKKIENIKTKSLSELLSNTKVQKKGDAKLGVDEETNQPVVLPLKDRFLHMLILGPTGSGKTSRIILPMIYDDIMNDDLGVIVLEPKGDLAEKVYAIGKMAGRKVVYFNPMLKGCPYFNPLLGEEDLVIENIVTTFKMLDNGTKTFFQDNNENLLRRGIKVVKRLYGNKANLALLETLLMNTGGKGNEMINRFERECNGAAVPASVVKENADIASWFKEDYYTGATGQRGGTKTYENTSGVRNQLSKLIANSYLKKVLNPPEDIELNDENCLDFVKCLEEGNIITISSAQGSLRDLGKFLGYFLILQLQSAVFSRPGNENTRRGCMLYIDEFQTYANSGFSTMLEQGRSYRVASHLATQTRAAIGMNSGNMGRDFTQIVSANCRNVVLFHDVNVDDALYYSKAFGQTMQKEEQRGITRQRGFIRRMINYTGENEQIRYTEKLAPRFTDSDIIYGPADEIIYKIIVNMNVQDPGRSKVSWLPLAINNKINEIVDEYNEANVINHKDYNPDIISVGFDESNSYAGVKIELDDSFSYIDSDLMGESKSNEPESIEDIFGSKSIDLNSDNNSESYNYSNNDSIDTINNNNPDSSQSSRPLDDEAEEDDI
jgi:type IV secretory pathway TraG/TraD family ATPase VirD4